jgi:hypothetical protein
MPILALVCLCCRAQAQPVAIIPEPVSTQWHDGHFLIDEHTLLIADDQDQPSVSFFNDYLQRLYGLRLHVAGPGGQPLGLHQADILQDARCRRRHFRYRFSRRPIYPGGQTR